MDEKLCRENGNENFFEICLVGGRKENKWSLSVFFSGSPKSFLPKIWRKLKGEIGHHFWTIMPMYSCNWAFSTLHFFTFFFFFPAGRCLFFFFFYSFFF